MGILAKLLPKALKRWLLASLEEGDRDGISRRAATSLQESEARFSRLFEQSPIPMCFGSDSDGFATTQWNQAWFSSFGFDPARDQGKSGLLLDVWVNPQDRTGVIEKSLRGEAVNDVEVRMRTATGALRWISLSSRVLAESTRTLVLFTYFDITDRKDIQQALVESERRFHDFAHASGDWFWETDVQGRFVWLSDAIETLTGLPATAHYGRTRADFVTTREALTREPWKSHLETLVRHEAFRDFQYVRNGPLGEQWLSSSGVPYFDAQGGFLGYRGVGHDITQRVLGQEVVNRANEQLRAAVEELNETFLLCDPQGRIVLANRRCREVNPVIASLLQRGATFEEFLREACALGYYPEAVGRTEAFIEERLARRGRSGETFERLRGDGTWFLMSELRLADGSIITMGLDITERKRIEDELRASRQLMELVMDSIPMSLFVKDRDSNYVLINQHFADFHRSTKQAMLGRHTLQLPVPDATRLKSLQDDERVFLDRKPLDQPDTLLQDADGNWVPFHSTKLPLLGAKGEVIGLLGINRDISAEKRSQQDLQASEARFSALFHNSLVPQVVSNPRNRATEDVNEAFVKLMGYPRERLLGVRGSDLELFWSAEDRDLVGAIHDQGGAPAGMDIRIRRADGEQRTVIWSAFTISTAAGPRIAWSLSDVTDQRTAQRQLRELNEILEHKVMQRTAQLTQSNADLQTALQNLETSREALLRSEKLAALGRIVAAVSHDLNTPIGNSLLTATTLSDHTRAFAKEVQAGLRRSTFVSFLATAQEATAILQRNLERANELIRSFKRVASDQTSSVRRVFELKDVVDEIVLSLRPTLKSSQIEIQVDTPQGIELDSYPGPLGQVLGNLINNAVLHGYEGSAAGVILIQSQRQGANEVVMQVKDFGGGIPQADLNRIFDPFFTTRLGKGGSGLGLNIVHNLVTDVLGGTVTAESEPGRGACFTITVPLVAPMRSIGPEEG